MAVIELYELGKSFRSSRAVESIDLRVDSGQLVAVVGPSGCGKTTLLRIIAGLETPDSGGVRIDGRSLDRVAPHRREIGFVFQESSLYPHLTVRENLAFPLRQQRVQRAEIVQRVLRQAEDLQIESLLDRYPGELSGGQRQRVAIGRAIIRRPRVLLLDEPLSQLDAMLRVRLREELVRLHTHLGATTILVTHDASEAMAVADRVIVMRDGQLVQDGSPEHIYTEPASLFVAEFFGNRPMNLVAGSGDPPVVRCPAQVLALNFGLHGTPPARGKVQIGFRPESVQVRSEGNADPPASDETPMDPGLHLRADVARVHREEGRWVLTARVDGCPENATITTFVPLGNRPEVGTRMQWHVPLCQLHLFDEATGNRLGPFARVGR